MNCLCCGKPFHATIPPGGWHRTCVRRFFGTEALPVIDLNNEAILALAEKSVQGGRTVPGVQKKLSLHLSQETPARLTLVDYPTGYILKPQVAQFPFMPEAEHLVMLMAESCGLSVVPHALIRLKDSYAFITRRIDRLFQTADQVQKLAMEDFCQLSLRLTQDKYKGSYEQCVRIIRGYSSRPGLDLSELFLRLVFCYLTGNSDMHLKNFSLIESAVGSEEYMLSPAYDLLPVNLLLPEDTEEFALQMSGKKTNIRNKHFLAFAEYAGISSAASDAMIKSIVKMIPVWMKLCDASMLPEEMKHALAELIQSRAERIQCVN